MIKNFFWHLLSDKSPLNPTVAIGVGAFFVMSLFALADVGTGLFQKELVVSNIVYESFAAIVGAAFLGSTIQNTKGNVNLPKEPSPSPEKTEE
jgi:hypothetical protein